jgi:hypothetical protein
MGRVKRNEVIRKEAERLAALADQVEDGRPILIRKAARGSTTRH